MLRNTLMLPTSAKPRACGYERSWRRGWTVCQPALKHALHVSSSGLGKRAQVAARLHNATASGALAAALRGTGLPVGRVRLMSVAPLALPAAAPAPAPADETLAAATPLPPAAPPAFSARTARVYQSCLSHYYSDRAVGHLIVVRACALHTGLLR